MSYDHVKVDEEKGYPVCDQDGCDSPVHVTLTWTKPQQYCLLCANRVFAIADAMGHPTPRLTAARFDLADFEAWKEKQS